MVAWPALFHHSKVNLTSVTALLYFFTLTLALTMFKVSCRALKLKVRVLLEIPPEQNDLSMLGSLMATNLKSAWLLPIPERLEITRVPLDELNRLEMLAYEPVSNRCSEPLPNICTWSFSGKLKEILFESIHNKSDPGPIKNI